VVRIGVPGFAGPQMRGTPGTPPSAERFTALGHGPPVKWGEEPSLTVDIALYRLTTMGKDIRITGPTLKVIGQILTASDLGISGAEISRATDIASGTVYPILFRLEKAGWVSSEWEERDPSELGRPRKRTYRLTATGVRESKLAFQGLVPNGRLAWLS
jgi:PadR family transcriptional regulator PadR